MICKKCGYHYSGREEGFFHNCKLKAKTKFIGDPEEICLPKHIKKKGVGGEK